MDAGVPVRIRWDVDFEGRIGRPRRWIEQNCKTTTELLDCHPIVHEVNVAGERKNLESEPVYWAARVAELNRKYGIG